MPVVRQLITRIGFSADLAALSSIDRRILTLKRNLIGVTVAAVGLGYAFGSAVKEAANFQTALSEVLTLLEGTAEETEIVTNTTRELSKEFGRKNVEVAKGLYQTISAGFTSAAESAHILKVGLKLAVGGVTETRVAVDGLTTILKAYGLGSEDALGVSDKLFTAMRLGKTTISELSQTIGRAIPNAVELGVSIDEVLAAVTALTLGGLRTDIATISMRGIFATLSKPSEEAKGLAAQMGIVFDATKVTAMGFQNWLSQFAKKVRGREDIAKVMATFFPNIRAKTGASALVGKQFDDFIRVLGEIETRTGATDKAVSEFVDDFNFQAARFGRALDDVQVQIGNEFLPALTSLSSGLANVLDGFSNSDEHVIRFTSMLLTAGLATTGLAVAFGVLSLAAIAFKTTAGGILLFMSATTVAVLALILAIEDMWVALDGGTKKGVMEKLDDEFEEIFNRFAPDNKVMAWLQQIRKQSQLRGQRNFDNMATGDRAFMDSLSLGAANPPPMLVDPLRPPMIFDVDKIDVSVVGSTNMGKAEMKEAVSEGLTDAMRKVRDDNAGGKK